MKTKAFLIAAPGSGSGKTLITCGVLEAFKKRGLRCRAFKCGPDYIDPMFHKKVLNIPCKNLDTFFTGKELTNSIFTDGAEKYDISVLEGVMGLYDGAGGITDLASSYDLARVLGVDIVIVIDAKGMSRTVLSLIKGLLADDSEHRIKGVILNRMSVSLCSLIEEEIEKLGIKCFGCFPEDKELDLKSRHLGLVGPDEIDNIELIIEKAGAQAERTLKLDELSGLETSLKGDVKKLYPESPVKTPGELKIGVSMDEAFCFYYEDNLELLKRMGAEVVSFSPLHDSALPEDIDGIYLIGGYPELYLNELSSNTGMIKSIRDFYKAKKPIIAECGGFMYLTESITDDNGQNAEMVNIIKSRTRYKGRSTHFGYVEITGRDSNNFLKGTTARGHEFHYYESEDEGKCAKAVKPVTGRSWDCVHAAANFWAGFPHVYFYSDTDFVKNFLEAALKAGKDRIYI
ncbi:MAG: cobyrinate a,c-diamide synthase [Lachnospiraceae bacterium]|nr:cobyrinate a,c-diamide synthase [Lachnospiraceae bacterium]